MPTVSFDDIGGLDDVKRQMREMIEFPVKYKKMFRDLALAVRSMLLCVCVCVCMCVYVCVCVCVFV